MASDGNGDGVVYLAHAWVPYLHRPRTVGPWHWWNVYKDEPTATGQAARRAAYAGWKGLAKIKVRKIEGET